VEALSKEELKALLAAALEHKRRDWLMILVTFSHGLRASEVVALRRDAVADAHITVSRRKGSLKTTQPLLFSEDSLFDERGALSAYVASLRTNQRLFPICRQHFWRLMQRYADAAGIPERKRHPHILKHTVAMQIIHKAGIENTRQYLGHKSIASTGAYLKVTDADASAAAAAALGDPR